MRREELGAYARIKEIVQNESALEESMYSKLGLWNTIIVTWWMIRHPHKSARVAANGMRNSILKKIDADLDNRVREDCA